MLFYLTVNNIINDIIGKVYDILFDARLYNQKNIILFEQKTNYYIKGYFVNNLDEKNKYNGEEN